MSCPVSSFLSGLVSIYLQIFPLKRICFTWKWFLTEHTLNTFNTFFTLMSCTEKRQVFTSWITGRSISFFCKNAWNVLVFKEPNHVKIKKQSTFIYFSVISLKFLITNSGALIPFLFDCFFCLKSKNLLSNF